MKKIICVHLYNDFSGSPLVLSTAIKGLQKGGNEVVLMTSHSDGFLSELDVQKVIIPYQFEENKVARLFALVWNQWQVFRALWKYRREEVTIYINTLLPFGAALAGKLMGKPVIYHIHETSVRPAILKGFLKKVATLTAQKAIYVSKYLHTQEALKGVQPQIIHNALSTKFEAVSNSYLHRKIEKEYPFTILMLCSLKKYKGVDQFVTLAKTLPRYNFELVMNATPEEIKAYFKQQDLSENLSLFPRQSNVHPFYQRASLVMNMSDPQEWVETFGMTLLEGFSYGIPAIAPPVGGPTEVVQDGYNGYLIDPIDLDTCRDKILAMANDENLYALLSKNTLLSVRQFNIRTFQKAIQEVIEPKQQIHDTSFFSGFLVGR